MTDQTIAEIVTFRLTGGTDPRAFAEAAHAMEPFLQTTGGFLARSLSVDDNGAWTDHILWATAGHAARAAARISTIAAANPFMAMIDGPSVQMRHARVHLQQEAHASH